MTSKSQQNNANATPSVTGMDIQTSCYGKPIPLVFGETRIAGNLIDYGGFLATTVTQSSGSSGGKGGITGGGGKGSSGQSSTTFSADVLIGLCEGPITGVRAVWVSQSAANDPTDAGFTIFNGPIGQTPWSTWASIFGGTRALGYSGLAYAGAAPYNLGTSAQLPNLNFEVQGLRFGTAPNGIDADASLVVSDLLTNPNWGAGFPAARLGQLTQFNESYTVPTTPFRITVAQAATYSFNICVIIAGNPAKCVAASPTTGQYSFNATTGVYQFASADSGLTVTIRYASLFPLTDFQNFTLGAGLWISPAYDTQTPASSMLTDIGTYLYSSWVWSSGALKLVPRATSPVIGNGFSYTPNLTPVVDLTDDDYLPNQGTASASASSSTDPVIVTRTRPADQYNNIKLEFEDRNNAYAASVAEITDQALLDKFGRRAKASQTAHIFADIAAANVSVQYLLVDEYIRNMYSFTVDERFCFLDPMDPVTLTDTFVGLNRKLVRITEITENDDGSFSMTAEEMPASVAGPATYDFNPGQGAIISYDLDPGFVNTPILFEPPLELQQTHGMLNVMCALSGASTMWGGCQVWVSTDNVTYAQVAGLQRGPARMGVTTADFPVGSDPDTAHALAVDLTMSNGTLLAGTTNDADLAHTVCVVKSVNGIEFLSYSQATFTATNKYSLGAYLRRGQFGSPITHAPVGASFARLDNQMFAVPYTPEQIGLTLYLKFPSFNIFDGGLQSVATVPFYTFQLIGPPLPPNVTGFSARQVGGAVSFVWTQVQDAALVGYDILYSAQGAGIGAATFLTEGGAGTEMTNSAVPPGSWTFYIRGRDVAGQFSPTPATFDLVVTSENPVVLDDLEAPGWPAWVDRSNGFVKSWDGLLVPDSTTAASGHTNAQLFEQYVPFPVAVSFYRTMADDVGFDSALRVFFNNTVFLGRSQTAALVLSNAIDTWLTGGSDPNSFTTWTIGQVTFRYIRGEIRLTNTATHIGYVQQFEMLADQTEAITDGNAGVTVAGGGTPILFDRQFHQPPAIVVTPITSGTALIGSASNITTTGCTLHVYNTSGTDVGGTVNWVATGD